MHIPDGYIGPHTYVPLYGAFVAFMGVALRKIRQQMAAKDIPYLGMAAAFVFIIMMFNVPIPGGTTGHATGAALIALLLGPWTAVVSVSVALIIQALMFGDGGITAIGANCINMGVVMPFVAWYVFKLFNGKSEKSGRMWMAAFFAGYISLTVAALITAIQFGIQPLIEVSPEGLPLYAPYPLKIAIPAMAIEHLVLFSIVEGVVTALIFRYFYHNKPEMVTAMRNVKKQSSI